MPPLLMLSTGPVSVETLRAERVLHRGVSQHQFPIFQEAEALQQEGVHPQGVVQAEGVPLESRHAGQGASDFLGQRWR